MGHESVDHAGVASVGLISWPVAVLFHGIGAAK